MSLELRILCMLAGAFVSSVVFRLLLKRKMDEANSFLWLPLGFIALISGFFPELMGWLSKALSIDTPATLVLMLAIILMILIVFKNTIEISVYKSENHELSMHVSMLNSEVRGLIEFCKTLQQQGKGEQPSDPQKHQFERPL